MEFTRHYEISTRPGMAGKLLRLSMILPLLCGCAGSGSQSAALMRDPLITGCPHGSVRTCEVIGGNKFQKRYGRCVCAAR